MISSRATVATTAILASLAVAPAAAMARGEVVVRFAPGADRAEALRDAGAGKPEALGVPRAVIAEVAPGTTTAEALAALRARDDVLWAEAPAPIRAFRVPDDPLLVRQWGLLNPGGTVEGLSAVPGADIRATLAWDVTVGDPSVTVAVADTGIARAHPDLAPNLDPVDVGVDYVDGDRDPADLDGHGTLVAGVIGARGDDGQGLAGVTWRSRLLALRVLDGAGEGSTADLAAAFAEAGRRGIPIVNASLGGSANSAAVRDAIAASPGTLFIVAAGNDGVDVDRTPTFPCAIPLDNVLCVASTTPSDGLSGFSNYGGTTVDVAAPGSAVTGPSAFGSLVRDDFETDLGGRWVVPAGSSWARDTSAAAFGSGSLSESPGGAYGPGADEVVQLAGGVDLRGRTACRVEMRALVQTAGQDGLLVQAAVPSGPWQTLEGRSVTGDSNGRWVPVTRSLGAFAGQPTVLVRLRFVGNGSGQGVNVDDFRVACAGGPFDPRDTALESGTSFASPHVAGVAALVAARHPGLTPAQIKRAILEGSTPVPALAGRVVSGGRLDAAGALRVADSLAGTPPPAVPSAAPGPQAAVPLGGTRAARFSATLAAPRRRAGVWTADIRFSRTALTEVVFERRVARPRPRFVIVRTSGPRDRRAGLLRVRLGRLGRGVYRVTVRFPEERRVLRRTLVVRTPLRTAPRRAAVR